MLEWIFRIMFFIGGLIAGYIVCWLNFVLASSEKDETIARLASENREMSTLLDSRCEYQHGE